MQQHTTTAMRPQIGATYDITLRGKSNFQGVLYCVDPQSKAWILAPVRDGALVFRAPLVVFDHGIKSRTLAAVQQVLPPTCRITDPPRVFFRLKEDGKTPPPSPADCAQRIKQVCGLLTANKIPHRVASDESHIAIMDQLVLHAPFRALCDCTCANEIVVRRVASLLSLH